MLERYFVKPQTVDRIRASWIGSEVEQYVAWLDEREYAPRSVLPRVPVLVAFGEFAWAGGARTVAELPGHVEGFVAAWMTGRPVVRQGGRRLMATGIICGGLGCSWRGSVSRGSQSSRRRS
jgi:integrase/recombinase XerD